MFQFIIATHGNFAKGIENSIGIILGKFENFSENIKPSEVSEVLLQQLKGIDTHLQFDEVGNVLQVSDGCLLYTSRCV